MAAVFALAPRAFPTGRTLLPTVISILGLAGLDPAPAGYGPSALPFLRGGDHNAFSEAYLGLALVVLGAVWAAALVESGPRWRRRDVLGLALVGGLAVLLAATGIVGLPLLQPKIERALAQALDQGASGLSGESTLGEFAELAVSRRRVLDLRTSDPQAGPWLLRSEVFTDFDGRQWRNAARPAGAVGPGRRPFSNPASPRLVWARSSPIPAPGFPRTQPARRKAETRSGPRSRSSSTSRTWDAGRSCCRTA